MSRLPPGASELRFGAIGRALTAPDSLNRIRSFLRERCGGREIRLHRSGREALRFAFDALAVRSGRREVIIPGYTCYSLASAAVAAGLSVRLVDVAPAGGPDPDQLASLPLDSAAAIVIDNLFGLGVDLGRFEGLARAAGVALVDDAAQALGAVVDGAAVGSRGDVGILSFGWGKPLSGLGGGASAWPAGTAPPGDAGGAPHWLAAALRAGAYRAAQQPNVFDLLSRVPWLGIGQTHFDPAFSRGGIPGSCLALVASALGDFDAARHRRERNARQLAATLSRHTELEPLLPPPGNVGAFPRLAVLAKDRSARNAALESMRPLGASAMYPDTLDRVRGLAPHLVGKPDLPIARAFADRLLTLPTTRAAGSARYCDAVVAAWRGTRARAGGAR
jgi:dTDP-4-amino-4,6-dideoxygalactose transaminase